MKDSPPPPRPGPHRRLVRVQEPRGRDDSESIAHIDMAEARARQAVNAVLAERKRADAERQRADEAERQLAILRIQQANAPKVISSAPPDNSLVLRKGGKKYVIPIGLLTAALPVVVAMGQRVMYWDSQVKELTALIAKYEEREAKQNQEIAADRKELQKLRNTVSRLSGYLSGVLPLAGVDVEETEPGATHVDIDSFESPAAKKRPKVLVRTPVPAPAPVQKP